MKSRSWAVAFCALMAALGAALMAAGGLIPIATYCAPMIAAVLLIPVMEELGRREAWMVWAVTAALSLILSPDKEAGSMYLFLGWYPILKPGFDRLRPRLLGWAAKAAVFALAFAATTAALCMLWLSPTPAFASIADGSPATRPSPGSTAGGVVSKTTTVPAMAPMEPEPVKAR